MHINLFKFYQFVLKLLSGNENLKEMLTPVEKYVKTDVQRSLARSCKYQCISKLSTSSF